MSGWFVVMIIVGAVAMVCGLAVIYILDQQEDDNRR